MSWIARSLASSLGVNDDDEDEDETSTNTTTKPPHNTKDSSNNEAEHEHEDPSRGVKEDLSQLRKTLTRQLWGVATFLAPPPSSEPSQSSLSSPPPPSPSPPPLPPRSSISDWNRWDSSDQSASDQEVNDPARITGIRNDFAEIGGRFKTGISKIRDHRAVSEISKIASTFLPFGIEEEEDPKDLIGDAVGVTNEVLAFARNISMHPETWLDFPLPDDEDSDGYITVPVGIQVVDIPSTRRDFDLSDAQQEHALAVERLAPRLAALRIELCPGYMSEGCFWKVYFALLHSRLNKHDAELLSTPQIEEARAMLMQDIQSRTKSEPEWSAKGSSYSKEPPVYEEHHFSSSYPKESMILKTFATESTSTTPSMDFETEKHPVVSTEMEIIDKSVVEEEPVTHSKSKDLPVTASKAMHHSYEDEDDDGDDWLQDEGAEMGGFSGTTIPIGTEEDVSFSDLEDDDVESRPTSSRTVANSSDTQSKKESQDWIQLSADHLGSKDSKESNYSKPENKETSDWLDVDEIDIT